MDGGVWTASHLVVESTSLVVCWVVGESEEGNGGEFDEDEDEDSSGLALKEQSAQLEHEKQALLHNENLVAEVTKAAKHPMHSARSHSVACWCVGERQACNWIATETETAAEETGSTRHNDF